MKYLGIDYGAKRIGLSVSDGQGTIAFPRDGIPNNEKAISAIETLIRAEKIEAIVVGDTRALGGSANAVTSQADEFIAKLTETTGLPLSRAFEGWSSIEASRYAPEGAAKSDSAAAAIILQRFLDMSGSGVEK